jgi:hypothetical protein
MADIGWLRRGSTRGLGPPRAVYESAAGPGTARVHERQRGSAHDGDAARGGLPVAGAVGRLDRELGGGALATRERTPERDERFLGLLRGRLIATRAPVPLRHLGARASAARRCCRRERSVSRVGLDRGSRGIAGGRFLRARRPELRAGSVPPSPTASPAMGTSRPAGSVSSYPKGMGSCHNV